MRGGVGQASSSDPAGDVLQPVGNHQRALSVQAVCVHGQFLSLGSAADAVAAGCGVGQQAVLGRGQVALAHQQRWRVWPVDAGQRLADRVQRGRIALEGHAEWRQRRAGHHGLVSRPGVQRRTVDAHWRHDAVAGFNLGHTGLAGGVFHAAQAGRIGVKGEEGQLRRLATLSRLRDAVDRAGVNDPAQISVFAQRKRRGNGWDGPAQEGLIEIGRLAGLQLWMLVTYALLHQGVDALEQVAVAQRRARLLQRVLQVVGERAAALQTGGAREDGLFRSLLWTAGGQQNVPSRRDGCPGHGWAGGACLLLLQPGHRRRRHDVAGDGPGARVGLLLTDGDVLGVARAGAGVTAVEDHREVRAVGRHLGDELGQFLVSQIPAAGCTAVVADQRLIQVVRLEVPEFGRRVLLRPVAGVAEERHVTGAGLAEMAAPGVDDPLAGGLRVG